jgi:hypothetical protein
MTKLTLPQFRTPSTLLKYTMVLSLLFTVGLSIFADWHNPAHVLTTDQHCALCISSLNLDNSLPSSLPYVSCLPSVFVLPGFEQLLYYVEFVRISGNRDPPSVF